MFYNHIKELVKLFLHILIFTILERKQEYKASGILKGYKELCIETVPNYDSDNVSM
jgi:hypothetical protein